MKNNQTLTLSTIAGMVLFMLIATIVTESVNRGYELEQPGEMPVLISPAGYALIIWGFIYGGLIAFAIYQAIPSQKFNTQLEAVRPFVIINSFINAIWFVSKELRLEWLTMLSMLAMLILLGIISTRLKIGRTATSVPQFLFVRIPFTLYFGWITAATPIHIMSYLSDIGMNINYESNEWYSTILLGLVMLISAWVYFTRHSDFIYLLVIMWAFSAIGVANIGTSEIVSYTAFGGALLAVIIVLIDNALGKRKVLFN